MRDQIRWLLLVLGFVASIAVSLGCATTTRLLFTDRIAAIGDPDESLLKAIGQQHAIALLGKRDSYIIYASDNHLEQLTRPDRGNTQHLNIKMRPGAFHIDGATISGYLMFTCEVDASTYVKAKELGFPIPARTIEQWKTDPRKKVPFVKSILVYGARFRPLRLDPKQIPMTADTFALTFYGTKAPMTASMAQRAAKIPNVETGKRLAFDILGLPTFRISAAK